jgi:hypothetical protein
MNINTCSFTLLGVPLEDVWDDRGELKSMTAFEEGEAEPEE